MTCRDLAAICLHVGGGGLEGMERSNAGLTACFGLEVLCDDEPLGGRWSRRVASGLLAHCWVDLLTC